MLWMPIGITKHSFKHYSPQDKTQNPPAPSIYLAAAINTARAAADSSAFLALRSEASCCSTTHLFLHASCSLRSKIEIFCLSCCLLVTKLCSLKINKNRLKTKI